MSGEQLKSEYSGLQQLLVIEHDKTRLHRLSSKGALSQSEHTSVRASQSHGGGGGGGGPERAVDKRKISFQPSQRSTSSTLQRPPALTLPTYGHGIKGSAEDDEAKVTPVNAGISTTNDDKWSASQLDDQDEQALRELHEWPTSGLAEEAPRSKRGKFAVYEDTTEGKDPLFSDDYVYKDQPQFKADRSKPKPQSSSSTTATHSRNPLQDIQANTSTQPQTTTNALIKPTGKTETLKTYKS